ncbi:Imidazole glycerol phosphate synthase amidotransferase subunit [hydrothermal vent metagenome]|uniref:Imidazole glycerol phosphate synthase amidotransferase subunit n=1 Tax=hydrothermal vent metagenome TaxID=652676 RepID=A0A1W1C6R5_9ZZZZ
MKSIAIVDYGMGNLLSVRKALEFVAPNQHIILTHNPDIINEADRVVFPGQGAMAGCMKAIKEHNLQNIIKNTIDKKPFLGICLGLQLLFENSEENNGTAGLGLFKGTVKKFMNTPLSGLKVPQIGWNSVKQVKEHPLWHNIKDNSYFYNVHSYFVKAEDESLVYGQSEYGLKYTSVIAKNNIFAVQFHPEKSQDCGLTLLKNFVKWDL